MTINKILQKAKREVLSYGKEETAALLLLQHVLKMSSAELYFKINETVSNSIENEYSSLLKKHLIENIPIQYIIGYQTFYGYDFIVNNNVLIPRYETEELVENVLYKYDEYFSPKQVKVADIGTGSGCIGLTLALEEPNMDVTVTDISYEALEVTKLNIQKLNVKVKVLQGDMLEPLKGQKFDILVSNPPYIPNNEEVMSLVKDNEPNLALFGGEDGLKFYRQILSECEEILNPQAIIAFEHAYDKALEIKELALTYFPDAKVESLKDIEGRDRMTIIVKGF